jgi:hypothetical protein
MSEPEAPERDWTASFGLSPLARQRMKVRVAAAEARKARDKPVQHAISGEPHGEYDPQTGRWVRSTWRTVL